MAIVHKEVQAQDQGQSEPAKSSEKADVLKTDIRQPHKEEGSEEFFDAVIANNVSVVLNLLRANKNLANDIDDQGRLPLHHACRLGHQHMVQILVDFEGNVFKQDWNEGRTALDEAFKYQASRDFDNKSTRMIQVIEAALQLSDSNRGKQKAKDKDKTPYYDRPMFRKLMIPIENVKDLTDYLYIIQDFTNL